MYKKALILLIVLITIPSINASFFEDFLESSENILSITGQATTRQQNRYDIGGVHYCKPTIKYDGVIINGEAYFKGDTNPNYPCSIGDGDCEPGQCTTSLTCSKNVGSNYGFSRTTDVCEGTGVEIPEETPIIQEPIQVEQVVIEQPTTQPVQNPIVQETTQPVQQPATSSNGKIAGIKITADDVYSLAINNVFIGEGSNWGTVDTYTVELQPGKNVIGVQAKDTGGREGLLVEVFIDGKLVKKTDITWKVKLLIFLTDYEIDNWRRPNVDFDTSSWETPTINRRISKSKAEGIGFLEADWIWGWLTRKNNWHAFRTEINLLDETFNQQITDAVLNNDISTIRASPKPISFLAIDQYSLQNQDITYCDEGTPDCVQKTLFFSCLEETNKETCQDNIISQIPQNTDFKDGGRIKISADIEFSQITRFKLESSGGSKNACNLKFTAGTINEKTDDIDVKYDKGSIINHNPGNAITETSRGISCSSRACGLIQNPLPIKVDKSVYCDLNDECNILGF